MNGSDLKEILELAFCQDIWIFIVCESLIVLVES